MFRQVLVADCPHVCSYYQSWECQLVLDFIYLKHGIIIQGNISTAPVPIPAPHRPGHQTKINENQKKKRSFAGFTPTLSPLSSMNNFGNQEPHTPVHPAQGGMPLTFAIGDDQEMFNFNYGEKRMRTLSHSEEPRTSGGRFVRANLVITELGRSEGQDISEVLESLFRLNAQQAGQMQYMQSQLNDVTSINQALLGEVGCLKKDMEATNAMHSTQAEIKSKKKRPSKEIRVSHC